MKKQYLYPQNMRTEAKLWFWGLKDIIILAVALTVSVVSWAKLNFIVPAALTLIYGFLSMRLDDCSVLDYIKRAARFFITTQQYFEWKEGADRKLLCNVVASSAPRDCVTRNLAKERIYLIWQIRNNQPPSSSESAISAEMVS